MALGRMRNNKRSSPDSYVLTVTTVVFIGLCVLAVWLLNSDSVVTTQTTLHTLTDTTGDESDEVSKATESAAGKQTEETENNPFDDNPGELPEDALKNDEPPRKEKGRGDDETQGENVLVSGSKESVEEHEKGNDGQTEFSEETGVTEKHSIQDNGRDEGGGVDSRRSDHGEEGRNGDRIQENEKEENQFQQSSEEGQDGKTTTFSDETKKESTKQDKIKDTKRQGKSSVVQPQEGESTSDSAAAADTEVNNTMDSNLLLSDEIPKESNESKKSWMTQAGESRDEKQRRKEKIEGHDGESLYGYSWKLCNVTPGPDYIPCLDNEAAVKRLKTNKHYEHRERHCPEDPSTCLVPFPSGYKSPIRWPQSRDKIWFNNVPHVELAKFKGHQNWVKVAGELIKFPGGGTQFIHGALHYIDFIEKTAPGIKWGKHTRVVLDVGCGVASFGGYLFEKDVLTMSFAPKDEHEAQVQFALERGIPAISAVMGTQRLPFPSGVFDLIHCARCRVPWHQEGGRLLLELNRVLRPGGHFVWSATPVYQKLEEDVKIWEAMSALTESICWKLEKKGKDLLNKVGAAIYRKPINNECYDRREENEPPMCNDDDDPNASWYVPLQSCMHRIPTNESVRGSKWPIRWTKRMYAPPYWLNKDQLGIYGKPAPDDFEKDLEHWQTVVNKTYLNGLGISWSDVRNVMDMRAVYGGFAAALKDLNVWVLNVVNVNSPDTLPIIYERGLFGIYHDWCESFSTYPRTYDLLHADHLFSKLKERCELVPVMAEIDRIVRPKGILIVRDESSTIGEIENLLKSLHWEVHMTYSTDQEGILSATKSEWRPDLYAASRLVSTIKSSSGV